MRRVVFFVMFFLMFPLTSYSASSKKKIDTSPSTVVKSITDPDAPFGLKWLLGKDDLIKAGIVLTSKAAYPTYVIYSATNLPKSMDDTDDVVLIISNEYGLVKILWQSNNITQDAFGFSGKKRYHDLKDAINQKYNTTGKSIETMFNKLYTESDEFYQCLKYSGCGVMSTYWDLGFMNMALRINALGRAEGYVSLSYEHEKWSEVLNKKKTTSNEAL